MAHNEQLSDAEKESLQYQWHAGYDEPRHTRPTIVAERLAGYAIFREDDDTDAWIAVASVADCVDAPDRTANDN